MLLTLLLLGASFYALSYNYLVGEKRDEMKMRAQLIVQLTSDYIMANGEDEAQNSGLSRMAGVASMMTEVNFLICDENGQALLTTDDTLAGRSIRLPGEITDKILNSADGFEGYTTLSGLYKLRQFAVGLPVKTSDGQVAGMVLAMIDGSQLMRLWRSFTGLFFMISAIVLLIAFVASSFMSMRQIQPIKEMLKGTRAYAAGNFDMRIEDEGRSDEIGELARSFNMMADSLLETERQRRDFIANISHELKTPMTSIAGYTDGILDGTIPQKDERKYLQIISDESHRLSRLVRRMLDISQIQSQEMHKEDFDLCESMRIALLSMEQKINHGAWMWRRTFRRILSWSEGTMSSSHRWCIICWRTPQNLPQISPRCTWALPVRGRKPLLLCATPAIPFPPRRSLCFSSGSTSRINPAAWIRTATVWAYM